MGQALSHYRTPSLLRIAALLAVTLIASSSPAQAPPSAEARTAAINRILADYHSDQTKLDPQAASLAGDKHFDDQLSDFSSAAANAAISRGQSYIQRLSEVDTTGLPNKTRQAAETLLNSLIDEQASDRPKTWENPLEQFTRFHKELLAIAAKLPFDSVKDYDDYLARLKKLPNAFSQIMTNVQLASEAGNPLPKAGVDEVMADVQAVIAQPAETSPFAAPLLRFPAAVTAPDRKRITADLLDTIANDVIPGYQRVGRFVAAHAGPAPTSAPALRVVIPHTLQAQ